MIDLRCPEGRKFAELDPEVGTLEVKCRDPRCRVDGVVVIHRFALSGELLETLRFKEPPKEER